ncbi:MAG: MFS transporter, partial [Betaproteobacteria bacterium]|nr:MFS transporter [Betaproteobacteria bacterium]
MSGTARADSRTLATLILLGIANHSVLTGSRVVVALDALSMGASPFTVGVLISLYSLLPVFLSVAAGRLVDRIGARRPMLAGSVAIGVGATLPAAVPGL